MAMSDQDMQRIRNNYKYHLPKDDQVVRYELLRDRAGVLAERICENCPDSRERSKALTQLEDAIMWANAAIARNE